MKIVVVPMVHIMVVQVLGHEIIVLGMNIEWIGRMVLVQFLNLQESLRRSLMTKLIVVLFGFTLTLIVSIWTMIYGWGLEPKSWWWIIGGGIFIRIMIALMEQIGKEAK